MPVLKSVNGLHSHFVDKNLLRKPNQLLLYCSAFTCTSVTL